MPENGKVPGGHRVRRALWAFRKRLLHKRARDHLVDVGEVLLLHVGGNKIAQRAGGEGVVLQRAVERRAAEGAVDDSHPKEKSKRPLFKLMDNAIVVIITIAIYTTKLSKPVMFVIIVFPLNMQIPCNNTATSTGIVNVPITFFTKCLFLFFMLSSPFIFQDIPYPLQINEFLTFHLFGESTASK